MPTIDATPLGPCEGSRIASEEFASCLAEAYCEAIERCGLGQFLDFDCSQIQLFFDDDLTSIQFDDALAALQSAARVSYDDAAGATCVETIETMSCDSLFLVDNAMDLCPAITGTVGSGGACRLDLECEVRGSVCAPIGMTSGGSPPDCTVDQTCRAPATTGTPCDGGVRCGIGDYCVTLPAQDLCRAGDLGDQCSNTSDCDEAFYCQGGDGAGGGTCQPALVADAACTSSADCAGDLSCVASTCKPVDTVGAPCAGRCVGELRCGLDNVCEPFAQAGDACAIDDDCENGLISYLICDDGDTPATDDDTCQSPGGAGEACTTGNDCDPDLHCSNAVSGQPTGACQGLRVLGAACNDDSQCTTGFCAGGTECDDYPICPE